MYKIKNNKMKKIIKNYKKYQTFIQKSIIISYILGVIIITILSNI